MKPKTLTAKFDPGRIVITPAAMKEIDPDYGIAALSQHLQGKWGLVCKEDWELNNKALKHGGRLVSSYPLADDVHSFWIITESDRSVTTILLPEDY